LELESAIIPEQNLISSIQNTLKTSDLNADFSINNHPKINALENKIAILDVERKLKANLLLPKIDIGYSYLSEPGYIDDYKVENYKIALNFTYPLFLRKERGNLKIAKYKLQETKFALDLEKVQLSNKIASQKAEITSLLKQKNYVLDLVNDNNIMLNSEERLFSFGESSLFLINTRENNLVTAQINNIAIENRFYISNADLYTILVNID
ncbi:MAG: TolC family protein, partial [Chryseobacterium sp.]|nr:TolC family protein [Chryseobacterium sp.]